MNTDIAPLYAAQRNYFRTGATLPKEFRIEQLKKFRRVIRNNENRLSESIYLDFGKSGYETWFSELALLYTELDMAIRKTYKWAARERVRTNLANMPGKSYVIPEPLGTVLVIGAWNYPYLLSLSPVVPAIAAGNTVILKPSEIPSHTSAAMHDLVKDAFPEEYFTVVTGAVERTTELLKQPFDKIFFSGSPRVGRIVYEAAAKNLTPATLELGGKSPVLVYPDCDLEVTARRLVWAKFLNAGQTCIAPDYIIVHSSIEIPLLEALKKYIILYHGEGCHLRENYVRISHQASFDRLAALIHPDQVYHGGHVNREERIIEPTILTGVGFDDEIMSQEIFGPLLPVIPYDDMDDAIRQVKSMEKPLSCYVFTRDKKTKEKVIREIPFGGGCVNDALMHISNLHLPFGGVGNSGTGRYHGKAGFDAFSNPKSILEKGYRLETNIKYPPYSAFKMKVIRWLAGR